MTTSKASVVIIPAMISDEERVQRLVRIRKLAAQLYIKSYERKNIDKTKREEELEPNSVSSVNYHNGK
ncbi:hypothetical protein SAMN05444392_101344 [Seinonella peptonophila]|uniref:Uncharacterized protein n=1 Tax=Seinonella peptonophila TaxID=112248 RepID=A0A1M4T7J3_9BACL|nr:hypothetical protein [Seinonella peptonophila]SHE40360.1 hypothetical protein SAMN05444392_101344 [Seinonella peptonophila]